MKKILFLVFATVALTACSEEYNYYNGNVKYVQEGTNCIYYYNEDGTRFSNDVESMNKTKKIVYRETLCSQLFKKDNIGQPVIQDRKVLTPAYPENGSVQSDYVIVIEQQ